jgi:hypothetical protein
MNSAGDLWAKLHRIPGLPSGLQVADVHAWERTKRQWRGRTWPGRFGQWNSVWKRCDRLRMASMSQAFFTFPASDVRQCHDSHQVSATGANVGRSRRSAVCLAALPPDQTKTGGDDHPFACNPMGASDVHGRQGPCQPSRLAGETSQRTVLY